MLKPIYSFFHRHYHARYHGVYRHARKLFFFDLALLAVTLLLLSLSIVLLVWKPQDMVDLAISLGDDRIRSGEEIKITIDYTNRSKFHLRDISLSLRLPPGFVINRQQTPKSVFSKESVFVAVRELAPGARGQVELYGRLWSQPLKEERIIADMSYQLENSKRREQELGYYIAKLSDSILESELAIVTSSLANAPLNFTYILRNNSSQPIEAISLAHNWPAAIFKNNEDRNISLAPGALKTITGQLKTPSQPGTAALAVTPQVVVNNHAISQNTVQAIIAVYVASVASGVSFINPPPYAEPRATLPVQVTWENKGGIALHNLRLQLRATTPGIVDWTRTARENHAKALANGILFDRTSRTSLGNGNPGSSDRFTINLFLKPTFGLNQVERVNLEIVPSVQAEVSTVTDQEINQNGSGDRIPLATELSMRSEAHYYTEEGDQLGRGPLPPTVGKTTKYWIFVRIYNTSNAVENPSFSTTLPAGISFTGKQSVTIGSAIKFDESSRTVRWSHRSLPANSQTGLYFEVAITPDASHIGQKLRLTDALRFSARDEFVGKEFNLTTSPILNTLTAGDRGSRYGSTVME